MYEIAGGSFVVTGGEGFIGKTLVQLLLSRGASRVVVIDPKSQPGNREQDRPSFVSDDLADTRRIMDIIEGCDAVFHFGASTDMTWKPGAEQRDLQRGLCATINLLEAMRQRKIERLVYASSSAVYGDLAVSGASETRGPLLPCSTYGAAKLSAEGWVSSFTSLFSWSTLIVRFGNVIGPTMNRGALFDIVRQLAGGARALRVLGDGSQGRTYIDVEDACACVLQLFAEHERRGVPEVFNVTGGGLITTLELAKIATRDLELADVAIETEGTSRGWPGDVPQVWLSTDKLECAGWAVQDSSEAVRKAARGLWNTFRQEGV